MMGMINPLNRVRVTTIKGKTFQIYLLPAGEGIKRASQLIKAFSPCVASIVEATQGGALDYTTLAYTLAEGLDNIDMLDFASRLLKDLSVNGQAINLDEYFMGNYGELVEVLAFSLKENFGSFFELSGFVEKLLPKMFSEDNLAE